MDHHLIFRRAVKTLHEIQTIHLSQGPAVIARVSTNRLARLGRPVLRAACSRPVVLGRPAEKGSLERHGCRVRHLESNVPTGPFHVAAKEPPDGRCFHDIESHRTAESARFPVVWGANGVRHHSLDSVGASDVDLMFKLQLATCLCGLESMEQYHGKRSDGFFRFFQQ